LRQRVVRLVITLGAIGALLIAANIGTGGSAWAHWPILGMATWLAWVAAPLFARGRNANLARALVIIAMLALINAFTWDGAAWFLWPAGVILLVMLLRRLSPRKS
jgi:hypothetical protein